MSEKANATTSVGDAETGPDVHRSGNTDVKSAAGTVKEKQPSKTDNSPSTKSSKQTVPQGGSGLGFPQNERKERSKYSVRHCDVCGDVYEGTHSCKGPEAFADDFEESMFDDYEDTDNHDYTQAEWDEWDPDCTDPGNPKTYMQFVPKASGPIGSIEINTGNKTFPNGVAESAKPDPKPNTERVSEQPGHTKEVKNVETGSGSSAAEAAIERQDTERDKVVRSKQRLAAAVWRKANGIRTDANGVGTTEDGRRTDQGYHKPTFGGSQSNGKRHTRLKDAGLADMAADLQGTKDAFREFKRDREHPEGVVAEPEDFSVSGSDESGGANTDDAKYQQNIRLREIAHLLSKSGITFRDKFADFAAVFAKMKIPIIYLVGLIAYLRRTLAKPKPNGLLEVYFPNFVKLEPLKYFLSTMWPSWVMCLRAQIVAWLATEAVSNVSGYFQDYFSIQHRYRIEPNVPAQVLPLFDMRATGMAQCDIKVQENTQVTIVHTRRFGIFIPNQIYDIDLHLVPLPTRRFQASLEFIAETALPKNISFAETPETVCQRLRHTVNSLQVVNYNKYVPISGIDLHGNSILVTYGIYLHAKQKGVISPFFRNAS